MSNGSLNSQHHSSLNMSFKGYTTETLKMKGCTSVSTDAFISFIAKQKQLKSINMCGSRKILSGLKDQTEAVFDLMKNVTCLDISDNSVQYLHGLGKEFQYREQLLTTPNVSIRFP